MGKSPARWIKTLLLGKKSSKSNISKGREKLNCGNKGQVLVSSKVVVPDLSVDPPSISAPIPVRSAWNAVESEKGIPSQLPNDGVNIPSPTADGSDATADDFGNPVNHDKIRLDQAAATVQAAFRGYLARRAFRTLKGIIRLQALIRGRLVRRQAVASLCCTWGIVKLQALGRGRKVRCSDIAVEKHLRLPQGSKRLDSVKVNASSKVKNLSNNVFVQKVFSMVQRNLTHPGSGFNDGQSHVFGNPHQNQLGVERLSAVFRNCPMEKLSVDLIILSRGMRKTNKVLGEFLATQQLIQLGNIHKMSLRGLSAI